MKPKQKKQFKTVRELARYIEAGGAVFHKSTREVYYSLRELPTNTESLLSILLPYTEAEMERDYKRNRKENETNLDTESLDMDELFEPEF